MALVLRYMRISDIYSVTAIDKQSFADYSWPARSFAYEVGESTYSFMPILEDVPHPLPDEDPILANLTNDIQVLGYGGLWCIADEGHVSTIATHPNQRGKGYGELVLSAMVQKSLFLEASYIVLEVRVSNTPAQALYQKYGFVIEDTKKNYYRDQEDAYDMRLDLADAAIQEHVKTLWDAIRARIPFEDLYTATLHPRIGK